MEYLYSDLEEEQDVRMVDTGDAQPRRQHSRRLPYVPKQEVTRQLQTMQEAGIIQPLISPWASRVILVCKKDGTCRFS